MTVITRFAPSPTGYLHIGGCRTALFNWLYARKNNGLFLLRIEDTDENRNVPGAVDAILNGLKWLGINHDKEIVSQNSRRPRHIEVVHELLRTSNAYWCNCPKKASREEEIKCGCKHKKLGQEINSVVRFTSPESGITSYKDAVYGEIITQNSTIEDMVILRSDGLPTYMLAVVVDDHDMEITHIIRGNDHITNTPKQILIYKAMNWDFPVFAHLPLMHDEDGKKLSKRRGAADINEYCNLVLPETMRNYLLRLGWASGDRDIINDTEALELFDLSGIGLSPANLDHKRLVDINGHYIQVAPNDTIVNVITKAIENILNCTLPKEQHDLLTKAVPLFTNRGGTNKDLAESMVFLLQKTNPDEEALGIILDNSVVLSSLVESLEHVSTWTKDVIVSTIKNMPFNAAVVYKISRSSIVGRMNAPSIADIMEILGKNECIERIKIALNRAANI